MFCKSSNYGSFEPFVLKCAIAALSVILLSDDCLAQLTIGANAGRYGEACSRLLALVEGPFGALITTGAGLGAIISSSVGGFKTAWTLIVVAVGAFILRSYITLFFAACLPACPLC